MFLLRTTLKKRGFQFASKYPLCGKADKELNHLLIHSFDLASVGGPHLYPKFILGMSLLAKGLVLELDFFPHKEEG